ncbi:MAG TPA: bifunctional salicylyl-CoA 5-hydroxylase/oxidoreductase [Myxococcales bacterium LLY-WYZ-16_1]|nr:bifunctional salicylyl-CoA 5-hydroxylase/oxidoreductase [Myxococcales bacterium LLY-WYZ-16_1]
MRIASIGGGPAGLYACILAKQRNPAYRCAVYERNRVDDTFGFGVVFSDQTLGNLLEADGPTYRAITEAFAHWDDIAVHFGGQVIRSTGHGFSGLSRKTLLQILARRAEELGVELHFEHEVRDPESIDADLVLVADGVNSRLRDGWSADFEPEIDWRPNRFVWLGTTFPFEAFNFWFEEDDAGLWRVHAYRYEPARSTFIVECTEETFARSGLVEDDEEATRRYFEALFSKQLAGHPLLTNRSVWRQFPTVKNRRWSRGRFVLMGDAAHTAHFSIGSGTKLALEDAISLVDALEETPTVEGALARYEEVRRPQVESTQRAAQVSLEWFENVERYTHLDPLTFSFSLLTRSLRITHGNLALRDPEFVRKVDEGFKADNAAFEPPPGRVPPMFVPYRLRDMKLNNRIVVSPMCMYSAEDGTVDDWHLVHLGSRAMGGAGLVMTEMTNVSRDGRITPGCAGIYDQSHVAAWRRITDFVHRHTEAKIGLQLGHAGRKGATKKMWEGIDDPLETGDWPLVAPSALPYRPDSQTPTPMVRADMDQVLADYVRATELALEADFDMLELHVAHGYLLSTFVSPLTNQRTDEYGGSLENRLRFPLEVFDAIRRTWPDERPLSVRISATDWAAGGVDGDDAVRIARAFRDHGVDIVDVSTGQVVHHERPRYGRLFQTPYAERIRLEANVPTMTVGAISGYSDVNSVLAAGRADLCVLARAHLFDPYWTRHAAVAQGYDLEWPDPYKALARYNHRFE